MNLGKVFDYINYTTNKEALGEPLKAEGFNMLLLVANSNFYDVQYKKVIELLEAQGISISVKMFNDTPLFRFLSEKSYAFGNTIPELAPLPDDLGYTLEAIMNYNNIWRPGELLDIESYNKRRINILSPSPKRKPIFIQKQGGYQFIPRNTRQARVSYLRKPADPYFDYCVGVDDDEIYFMEPGSQIQLESEGINSLYDPNSILVVSNVVHLTYTGDLPYTSITVELDWDEDDITKIADSIVAISSIKSREFNVAQSAAQSAT